ncbi:hypothetical protein [Haloferula rosea]|uniref:Uncharacterized protein n=1 Tax=Haloferula rosea TaxID=490093 RepID=A0A934RDF0_9BACT|nr:hypothetical protein [Haloferula rosea]MBK1826380.1 hypothetical protein [Haloferula rosea]
MKAIPLLLLLQFAACFGTPSSPDPFELRDSADTLVDYHGDGSMDLGIKNTDGRTLRLDLKQLRQFFDQQKHKALIVVVIAKQRWPDEKLREEVDRLRSYFIKRGYRRIVIQQATSGGHCPTYLDHTVPALPPKP